jgi:diguanylate cyclase (GGDEF)-like protein/PAS domain S-box-containing protein
MTENQPTNEIKPLVLVVDDEITARMITKEILVQAGFAVEEAEDGKAALELMEMMRPDIVLSDVMMPVMDGFTLCEEMRRRQPTRLTPVLMVTGLDDVESIHRAYDVGATDFITKPFNWLVLCQRIRHMVRERMLLEDLQRSEEKNSAILAAIPDMMFRIDRHGIILETKSSKDFSLPDPENTMIGKTLYEILPVGVAQDTSNAMKKVLFEKNSHVVEFKLAKDGVQRHFEARIVPNGDDETLSIVRDITTRKIAENGLRESEERYALAMEGASDGIWDWNIRTNEVYYSTRWKTMLGFSDQDIGNSPDEWFHRIHEEDIEQFRVLLNAHLEGASPHFEAEHRIKHRDENYIWVLTRGIAVRDEKDRPYRMAGSQTDVTDRRRAQDQLQRDALYDSLTGLCNRSLLMDRLEQALSKVKQSGDTTFAIIFLDLDRFKNINDTMGHVAGDKVLNAVARRLENSIRPGDTAARIGGDEFVILLENVTNLVTATTIAERIESNLIAPMAIGNQEIFTAASLGILLASDKYDKAEDILRDADIAVYRAKASGRGCHVTFEPAMYHKTLALLELESDLRKALDKQEFVLHYQPIVRLDTGDMVAAEALIRWQHPQRGLVSPVQFISLAEDTGLIIPIGEWVLRTVCSQISTWNKTGLPPRIAVNISGLQLRQPSFSYIVQTILEEFNLSPDSIEFELTETVLMDNIEHANNTLEVLRSKGFHLSLDDFGTGYSSLSYLHRFPVQKIKIDRGFIMKIGTDPGSMQIVSAVLQLAQGLGLDVVAEGVETDQTATLLRDLGCTLAQGYYFGRPAEASHMVIPPAFTVVKQE